MANARTAAQSRQALDVRLDQFRPVERFEPPVRGWIKAIRESLLMTTAQLAKRLKIKQPTVVAIEQSELKGSIQLATLRRAAAAMNCTLVYALVPNNSLERIVHERARELARQQLASVAQSMLLENQSVAAADSERHIDALAREMNLRRLWDKP